MNFSNDYFEDEVRDGFYVASVIKRIWAAQLEVLEDIDYGLVEDMLTERGNDEHQYPYKATQDDFDKF